MSLFPSSLPWKYILCELDEDEMMHATELEQGIQVFQGWIVIVGWTHFVSGLKLGKIDISVFV